jgi:hypothetical protein
MALKDKLMIVLGISFVGLVCVIWIWTFFGLLLVSVYGAVNILVYSKSLVEG